MPIVASRALSHSTIGSLRDAALAPLGWIPAVFVRFVDPFAPIPTRKLPLHAIEIADARGQSADRTGDGHAAALLARAKKNKTLGMPIVASRALSHSTIGSLCDAALAPLGWIPAVFVRFVDPVSTRPNREAPHAIERPPEVPAASARALGNRCTRSYSTSASE